ELRCPFCRRHSPVPSGDVQQLQDDCEALALLTGRERAKKRGLPRSPEVLLCPSVLEPVPSPDCLVVTILEVPEDVAPPDGLGRLDLCLLYFSSLPFGIYLLLIEHHSLGIVLVSLVPSTLLLCIVYSLCQCLC
ncbi:E3 ubiquitin-protein ligase RNF182, partial [Fulmarus glacialis]